MIMAALYYLPTLPASSCLGTIYQRMGSVWSDLRFNELAFPIGYPPKNEDRWWLMSWSTTGQLQFALLVCQDSPLCPSLLWIVVSCANWQGCLASSDIRRIIVFERKDTPINLRVYNIMMCISWQPSLLRPRGAFKGLHAVCPNIP